MTSGRNVGAGDSRGRAGGLVNTVFMWTLALGLACLGGLGCGTDSESACEESTSKADVLLDDARFDTDEWTDTQAPDISQDDGSQATVDSAYDSACIPTCEGRECGDDGCGGDCGICVGNESCLAEGTCVCIPECKGKECGDDGCGGICGHCGAAYSCAGGGTCILDCTTACAGWECGWAGDQAECDCGDCDDQNACTLDICDGQTRKCLHDATALDFVPCDDGNACSVDVACGNGVCLGSDKDCNDGNECTQDSCNEETGQCKHDGLAKEGAQCDDGNPCTDVDSCGSGLCGGALLPLEQLVAEECLCSNDTDCAPLDDDNVCNGELRCATEMIVSICVVDPITVLLPCDDQVDCTTDSCDPEAGCQHAIDPSACDDGNPCTVNVCSLQQAGCVVVAGGANGDDCDDGNVCTISDECLDDECAGKLELDCDDGNPCTDDSCDLKIGCLHVSNEAPCDDGNLCTVGDHCQGAWCVYEHLNNCADDVDCTEDWCDPENGCLHKPKSELCDDDNYCTKDNCDPEAGGCVHDPVVANGNGCDDDNVCTLSDTCQNGECIGLQPLVCDDGNPCTNEDCDPKTGCSLVPNLADCDDGNPCSIGDQCGNGWCQYQQWNLCDDGNSCTEDSCDPTTEEGCHHAPLEGKCNDGEQCTQDDVCVDGLCAGFAYQCNDGKSCTIDLCNGLGGCSYPVDAGYCLIGDKCVDEGGVDLDNLCFRCLPVVSPYDWSLEEGSSCPAPAHAAVASCLGQICTVVECELGWGNCDDDESNGCETNLATSPLHCDACNNPCPDGQVCSLSECKSECDPSLEECDGLCVDVESDPDFCGDCLTNCAFPNAVAQCLNSSCEIDDCAYGFGNANGVPSDGCECEMANGGSEGCDGLDDDCNGVVDDVPADLLQEDPVNCGKCGEGCESDDIAKSGMCVGGNCLQTECPANHWNLDGMPLNACEYLCVYAGQEECNDADDDCDGEVDETFGLLTDPDNCGECGHICIHETVAQFECENGKCAVVECMDGYEDANDTGLDGCEKELVGELWVSPFKGGNWPAYDGSEDKPFSTIQEAVEHALPDFVIHVLPGFYEGEVQVDVAGLSIEGTDKDSVVLSIPAYGVGITATAGGISVSQLTMTGGRVGVWFKGSKNSPLAGGKAQHLAISGLEAPDDTGEPAAGIAVDSCENVSLSDIQVTAVEGGKGADSEFFMTTGDPGGVAAAVYCSSAPETTINQVLATGITGGEAGKGGPNQGNGGIGGVAAGVYLSDSSLSQVIALAADAVTGGIGGQGEPSGSNGSGGVGAGVYLTGSNSCKVFDSSMALVSGGKGGTSQKACGSSAGTGGIGAGVFLKKSTLCTLSANIMNGISGGEGGYSKNGNDGADQVGFGVYLGPSSLKNSLTQDNTLEGDPIIYLWGVANVTLSGITVTAKANPTNFGKIAVVQSNKVQILDSVVANFQGETGRTGYSGMAGADGEIGAGISLEACSTCTVSGNSISEVVGGTGGSGANDKSAGVGGLGAGLHARNCTGSKFSDNEIFSVDGGYGGAGGSCFAERGGMAAGMHVANSVTCSFSRNVTTEISGGTGPLKCYDGEYAGGNAAAYELVESNNLTFSNNVVASIAAGSTKAEAGCVRIDDCSGLAIRNLTCHSVTSDGDVNGHGIVILTKVSAPVTVESSIISGISGKCLTNHVSNAPSSLRAVNSDLHECGNGESENSLVESDCIALDPLFVDADNGDYHLQLGSPSIDTGKPGADYCLEPEPNGCAVNMGAYGNTDEAASAPGADHCECQ